MNKPIAPILLSIFSIFWVALAINPLYRDIWVAEKDMLFAGLGGLVIFTLFHPKTQQ